MSISIVVAWKTCGRLLSCLLSSSWFLLLLSMVALRPRKQLKYMSWRMEICLLKSPTGVQQLSLLFSLTNMVCFLLSLWFSFLFSGCFFFPIFLANFQGNWVILLLGMNLSRIIWWVFQFLHFQPLLASWFSFLLICQWKISKSFSYGDFQSLQYCAVSFSVNKLKWVPA